MSARCFIRTSLLVIILVGVMMMLPMRKANAQLLPIPCPPCTLCTIVECQSVVREIGRRHRDGFNKINFNNDDPEDMLAEFLDQMRWMIQIFMREVILPPLKKYTEQMSAIGMQQIFIVGTFMDAKAQMETQRLFEKLQADAHRDYTPSRDFCWFGTNVRSLAASEQAGRYGSAVLNKVELARQLGSSSVAGSTSSDRDKAARWRQFTTQYCDPQDNGWRAAQANSGLVLACGNGGGDTDRINIDVSYTRAIEEPKTLDVRFSNGTINAAGSINTPAEAEGAAEQDILALANNIYGHEVPSRSINTEFLKKKEYQHLYLGLRAVVAKRMVAANSFNAIVAMKSQGNSDAPGVPASRTREYLGAVLTELGVPNNEVYQIIGQNPSYYAQLEILAKKLYQNPDFYANLYDKPANVARKSVALRAIELMLDRAIYESQIRREMVTSVLLAAKLQNKYKGGQALPPSGSGG
jgi:hypothetical protein